MRGGIAAFLRWLALCLAKHGFGVAQNPMPQQVA
jgi:hypothetical protein